MINTYFQESCIHVQVTYDQWGNPIENPVGENCKIEYKTKYIKNEKGEDVVSNMQVYLRKNIDIQHEDKIQVDSAEYPIIQIYKPRAFIFAYGHTEVFL